MKGISKDSPSLDGTSTNVTRLGAECPQTLPKGLQVKRQLSNGFIDHLQGYLGECRCKKSHLAHSMVPRIIPMPANRLTCSEYSPTYSFFKHDTHQL